MAKDLFSAQADIYARYRPGYPPELFGFLSSLTNTHDLAWDCATGNGQAASGLSQYFNSVIGTDISKDQLANAVIKQNIRYIAGEAGNSGLDTDSVDLITVAQAYHWLNWEAFRQEANRVGKRDATVAIWMYNRMTVEDPELEKIYNDFYFNITGPYWDAERKYVDENYETVDFHFPDAGKKQFQSKVEWNRGDFLGYLSTWSAVQKFKKANGYSPLDTIRKQVESTWQKDEKRSFIFPIYMRYGRIGK